MDQAAFDAVQKLSTGKLVWQNANGKQEAISLTDERARKILNILVSHVEAMDEGDSVDTKTKADDEEFYSKLETEWSAEPVEKSEDVSKDITETKKDAQLDGGIWVLESIRTIGFGGINGAESNEPFTIEVGESSTCFLGGNGSGKTSLISAIAWALTGQRINDAVGLSNTINEPRPIYDKTDPANSVGVWPPVATYPKNSFETIGDPKASVTLIFKKHGNEERAKVIRKWVGDVDGYTVAEWDEALEPIQKYLDIAVEMPLRISHLRFGEQGQLNDAVASLTGLDLLKSIGEFINGMKRSNSRFLNRPRKDEHEKRETEIANDFSLVETHLPSLGEKIAPYKILEKWVDDRSAFEAELKSIAESLDSTAGADLSSLESFIDPSLDLDSSTTQTAIDNAVAAAIATYDLNNFGDLLDKSCPMLTALRMSTKNHKEKYRALIDAAQDADSQLETVITLHKKKLVDKKLPLKAMAAETHYQFHGDAPIESCVLCEQEFDNDFLKTLGNEIKGLLADSEILKNELATSCDKIIQNLDNQTTETVMLSAAEAAEVDPIELLRIELEDCLVTSQSFTATLPKFGELFDNRFNDAKKSSIPEFKYENGANGIEIDVLPTDDQATIVAAKNAINGTRRAAEILRWASTALGPFNELCNSLLKVSEKKDEKQENEESPAEPSSFGELCQVLGRATKEAKPTLLAAKVLRQVIEKASAWLKDEETRRIRREIVDAIAPLGQLPNYVEVEVTRQLSELSDRIAAICEKFHISASLAFQRALIERSPRQRKGTVRARAARRELNSNNGGNDSDFEIDVTLVANASWIRALLWAFLFALRENRVAEGGGLNFPLILMDDPQLTFDEEHRCAWIEFVLNPESQDGLSPEAQAIFTTYDKSFARQLELQINDFRIRHIYGLLDEDNVLFVDGTELIDRLWREAEKTKTNEAASNAIGELRKHIENMMRAIYPREMGAKENTLGKLIDEFSGRLNKLGFPYETSEFSTLVNEWKEPKKDKFRKALSEQHHSDQNPYNYEFAQQVFDWYRKILQKRFQDAFMRIWRVREAGWKVPHSGIASVSVIGPYDPIGPSIPLPSNLNNVIARVAAESDGTEVVVQDGQPSLKYVEETGQIEGLGQLQAYVLAAATLEPAAFIGDILLVSPTQSPTSNSLVVCQTEGAWRARRLSRMGGSESHVVLTANAVNPREIRRSILVENREEHFNKVVAIIYCQGWDVPKSEENEVIRLETINNLESVLHTSDGLARIIGQSAEPIALAGQYLILTPKISNQLDLVTYDGKPIVVDLNGRTLFKRLRLGIGNAPIVLESIDAAGRYPPVVIPYEEAEQLGEALTFRPVLGILFDSQSQHES